MIRNAIVLCLAGWLVAAALHAQDPMWEILGTRTGAYPTVLERAWFVGGDLDRDGTEDVVLRARCYDKPPTTELWFVSGRSGQVLRKRRCYVEMQLAYFRGFAPMGDIDQDGLPDYAIVISGWNFKQEGLNVEVCSGRDDRVLWRASSPHTPAGVDVDGDGVCELVVYQSRPYPMQDHYAVYGSGGRILYSLHAPPGCGYDTEAIGLGDLDGDKCADFGISGGDGGNRGVVFVYSGRTGRELYRAYGEQEGDQVGNSLAACGDIDQDGYTDFLAGSNSFSATRRVVSGFSGKTGRRLFTIQDPTGLPLSQSTWGHSLAGGVDLDCDGVPDFAIANITEQAVQGVYGRFHFYSGRDLSRLGRWAPGTLHSTIGEAIAMAPPPAGERSALVLTAWERYFWPDGFEGNRICLHRFHPGHVSWRGDACSGSLSRIPEIGLGERDQRTIRIHLHGAVAKTHAVLLLGLSGTSFGGIPLPQPLDGVGLKGCELLNSVELPCIVAVDSQGHASAELPWALFRSSLQGSGASLFAQWWVPGTLATAPGGMSAGMTWRNQ